MHLEKRKRLAWLKLGARLGKVEVDETSEGQTVNGLACHPEDVRFSSGDNLELLGINLAIPSTWYKMISKCNLTRIS